MTTHPDPSSEETAFEAACRALDKEGRAHGWWPKTVAPYPQLDTIARQEFEAVVERVLLAGRHSDPSSDEVAFETEARARIDLDRSKAPALARTAEALLAKLAGRHSIASGEGVGVEPFVNFSLDPVRFAEPSTGDTQLAGEPRGRTGGGTPPTGANAREIIARALWKDLADRRDIKQVLRHHEGLEREAGFDDNPWLYETADAVILASGEEPSGKEIARAVEAYNTELRPIETRKRWRIGQSSLRLATKSRPCAPLSSPPASLVEMKDEWSYSKCQFRQRQRASRARPRESAVAARQGLVPPG